MSEAVAALTIEDPEEADDEQEELVVLTAEEAAERIADAEERKVTLGSRPKKEKATFTMLPTCRSTAR